MPPPPEPTSADRAYAREQAEAWCEEYSTDMGGGFAPNEHWVNGVASRILAGILREREWMVQEMDHLLTISGTADLMRPKAYQAMLDILRKGPQ